MTDIIQELGPLAFATRLKRLSERLQRDVSRIYREQKLEFHARWFPVAYLLSQESPMSVTAVAEALGLTHPAVNQIAGQMARRGLLVSTRDAADERRRLLALTRKGRQTVKKLQPLWSVVDGCTRQLIKATGHDLLGDIAAVEKALESQDMYDRIMASLRKQQSAGVPPGRKRALRRRRKSTTAAMNSTTKRKPQTKE